MSETRERVLVGPSLAKKWLQKVPEKQRSMRAKIVPMYAADMRDGVWMFSEAHTPLAFNERDEMIQGQHRLQAVVQSDTEQWFWVVRGVSDAVVVTLDTGIKRSAGDVLTMHGFKNGVKMSSIVQMYHEQVLGATGLLTHSEVLAYVQSHAKNATMATEDAIKIAENGEFRVSVKAVGGAMLAVLEAGADPYLVAQFNTVLQSGITHVSSHPAAILRRRYGRMHNVERSGNKGKINMRVYYDLYLQAWSHFLTGTEVATLQTPKKTPKIRVDVKWPNPFVKDAS